MGNDRLFIVGEMKWLFVLLCLFGCAKEQKPSFKTIVGRDHTRIYRVKAPAHWKVLGPEEPLEDTTKANERFVAYDEIVISVHTFPGSNIPPMRQIQRWVRQLQGRPRILQISFGGYVGFLLQGRGVIGLAMELDPGHRSRVQNQERKASFTIKAVGPAELLEEHQKEIVAFMKSFELIEAIFC